MDSYFPNITPGYCGTDRENLTLNSSFYGKIFSSPDIMKEKIIFPQRIPNPDFMSEMIDVETDVAVKKLKDQFELLKKKLTESDKQTDQEIINWYNVALRYSLYETILDTDPPKLSNPVSKIKIEFIKTIANTQLALFYGGKINPKIWIQLLNRVKKSNEYPDLIRLSIFTACIVASCRFGCKINESIHRYCHRSIISIINNFKGFSFDKILKFSFSYRGIAMLPYLTIKEISFYLSRAKTLAEKAIQISNGLDTLVAKENLYTCFQTLAKWHIKNDEIKTAINLLNSMTELDPFDTVGYAEAGFAYLRLKKYQTAEYYFNKAAELGPPSIGMHLYYKSVCLKHLGEFKDMEICLRRAIQIDPGGISLYLNLIDLYIKFNNRNKLKQIVKSIRNNEKLLSQLTTDEIKHIKKMEKEYEQP